MNLKLNNKYPSEDRANPSNCSRLAFGDKWVKSFTFRVSLSGFDGIRVVITALINIVKTRRPFGLEIVHG